MVSRAAATPATSRGPVGPRHYPTEAAAVGGMTVETLMYAVFSLPAAACAVAWLRVEWLAERGLEW